MIALYYSFHGRVDTRIFRVEKHRLQRNVNFLRNLRIISRTLAADRDRDRRPVLLRHSRKGTSRGENRGKASPLPSPPPCVKRWIANDPRRRAMDGEPREFPQNSREFGEEGGPREMHGAAHRALMTAASIIWSF